MKMLTKDKSKQKRDSVNNQNNSLSYFRLLTLSLHNHFLFFKLQIKKIEKVVLRMVSTSAQLRKFLRPFNGVSSKYLPNYLNWLAYKDKLYGTKSIIKKWFYAILATPYAYNLFLQFKDNAVNIRT